MIPPYFAYGSNLKEARLRERVGALRVLGRATLADHELRFDKPGADGSAKANLFPAHGEKVWGVLYELDAAAFARLDPFEGGYERIRIQVRRDGGEVGDALTYRSQRRCPEGLPFDWYRDLLVEGGREHGLPPAYLRRIAAWPACPDPRRGREP